MKSLHRMSAGVVRRVALAVGLALSIVSLSADSIKDLPTTRLKGREMYYYDTKPNENIYIIANKFGVTVDFIRSFNPSAADGITPRMRLFFPADISTEHKGDSAGPTTHVVAKDESIYGIAQRYGMTVDELYALNPEAAYGIERGQRLRLSDSVTLGEKGVESDKTDAPASSGKKDKTLADNSGDTAGAEALTSNLADQTYVEPDLYDRDKATLPDAETAITTDTEKEINIAVMLPFLLKEESMGKQTRYTTEFYKGFLLAADTLNQPGRTPVHIHTYDTAASLDTVKALMQRPEMATMDLFVVPDNQQQINAISASAPASALIYNAFAVRDTTYTTLPGMIQANIPHDEMYDRAIEGFIDILGGATPVFLTRKNGRNDKNEFTSALRQALSDKGIVYHTVNFDNYLSDSDLEEFAGDTGKWVFIPESGHRDEFTRIAPALKELRAAALNPASVRLFGYPEWSTFRGTQQDDLGELQATIYSRYAPVTGDTDARRLNEHFKVMYGESMETRQMPVLGILGYDSGRMIIDGLRTLAGRGEFPADFTGIQSGMHLMRSSADGGMFNNALFLITYCPGGVIEKTLK